MSNNNDVLCYDIETRTFGKPDPKKDRLKIFGCYSYKTGKTYMLRKKEEIQKAIDAHKFLVGFNNSEYDNPILLREGYNLKYKIIIDLRKIFKKRAGEMKIKEGMLRDILMKYSLDYITRKLGIVKDEEAKKKIDYSKFQKDIWTKEELAEILEYTKRDIDITRKLYEWVEEYFKSFKSFIPQDDVDKKVYLTVGTAKFAYKAICKEMNWREEYGDNIGDEERISGGYVAYPAGERFEGDIYCLDFNSLYPHILSQCNLYSRKKDMSDRPVWTGGGKWQVEGAYHSDNIAKVGNLIVKWYNDRVEFKKKGDRREYSIKIILNTMYGILDNPHYIRVHDKVASGDCTRIGRQWIKFARKIFKQNGYTNIYSDTDSCFLLDPFKNKDKMLKVKDKIINDIKATVPFPQCLAKGTLINVPGGTRKIEDIKVGDIIENFDGESIVINKIRKKVSKLLKITLKNGDNIFVTHQHRLLKNNKPVVASKLKIGDKLWQKKQ